ncbi:uncharacterized protein ARMOST_19235 [Armillaria ostoyae]|uniref:Uncharacterized protein n=1 Tax=Armillaria ostoyae TaxID=47428 RepID=A0A284S3Z7_ARMOS|nr:uncharacterized protein ARMOST_19235 [Armillaria ostoyae]
MDAPTVTEAPTVATFYNYNGHSHQGLRDLPFIGNCGYMHTLTMAQTHNQDFKATGCKQRVQDLLLPSSMRNYGSDVSDSSRIKCALVINTKKNKEDTIEIPTTRPSAIVLAVAEVRFGTSVRTLNVRTERGVQFVFTFSSANGNFPLLSSP